eukprot:scaffold49329_cov42-Prasinocladus_malaysianus.AAC.1
MLVNDSEFVALKFRALATGGQTGHRQVFLLMLSQCLSPGFACGCIEPGWFRMHVGCISEEMLAIGFDRMERCLKSKVVLHGNWYKLSDQNQYS